MGSRPARAPDSLKMTIFNSLEMTMPRLVYQSLKPRPRFSWRRLSDGIVMLIESFAEARRLRQAMRALHKLDDRMLADIGIGRGGIEAAVRDANRKRIEAGSTRPTAMAA
jgi:uncharacterized protein YjiS (DUF1127 family)